MRGNRAVAAALAWVVTWAAWFGGGEFVLVGRPVSAADAPAPSGKLRVYFGTNTGDKSKGIYRSELDLATGRLAPATLAAEITGCSFVAVHPGRKFLYAVTQMDGPDGKRIGAVGAFAIDAATGDLKKLNLQASGGAGPCHVTVDQAGKNVLVANYGGGSVAALPIGADGSLGAATSVIQHQGSSVNKDRQAGPHAHSINLDPANRFAFAADLGLDKVLVYKFDSAQGTLAANEPAGADVPPGSGPRHFAFHPTGKFAYVINEMASTVTAFSYDAAKGTLAALQTISTLPDGADGKNNSTAEVQVHPTGKFLYGSNRGHDSIAIFQIDQETGKLTAAGHQGKDIQVPRNFGIDPTGRYVVVASQNGDHVEVFQVDPATGALAPTGGKIDVPRPVCVKFVTLDEPAAPAKAKPAAAKKPGAKKKAAADPTAQKPAAPLKDPPATPISQIKVKKDFQVELLHSVPKDVEGSWVNMCVDPKGRLIVSDQYGGLYRVTPPALGKSEGTKVDKIAVDMGEAQGLLWAFDSLYVVVNRGQKYDSGLYRVRDTNGDDQLDSVETLRKIVGGGEHGPHAVLLTPDGKGLYIVCGNGTKPIETDASRVPLLWGEDHLLPRMPDGRGFMRDVLAPGGCIYQIDPDGKRWELISNGFRNEYDAAVNRHGDLFSYDADMEWDLNTPWYRPTRICQVTSGAEFGWRNGAGKWPAYYADSLPSVADVGPGSPTGVTFGYGAKFPAKYQEALFACDWSYGKLYAVHLEPHGSSYRGVLEEFITGTPLPLTDIVINPHDGAMYFTIGGRKTKSGLYRVTYAGTESTAPSQPVDPPAAAEARKLRRKLEAFHGRQDPAAVDAAWPYLGDSDRFLRFAARVALEHQDVATWRDRALAETDPNRSITAVLAAVRASAACPKHRRPDAAAPDAQLLTKVLDSLARIDWSTLDYQRQLELVRTYQVALNRLGPPADADREKLIVRVDPLFPAAAREVNAELSQLLVYLQAPSAATKTVALLTGAPTQEEQLEYARALRMLKAGWNPALRETYFKWFLKAASFKGGASFELFVANVKRDAVETLTEAEKVALKPILEAQPTPVSVQVAPARPLVKQWKPEELLALVDRGIKGRDFDRGRKMFGAANCFACHRFDNEGGAVGPDLTGLVGRFSPRDIVESVALPSKVISDQYQAVNIETDAGKVVVGRITNLAGENLMVNTNMLDPNAIERIDHRTVVSITPSKLSMMPEGLLNTLDEQEVLDLLAYLLSRGDRKSPYFQP